MGLGARAISDLLREHVSGMACGREECPMRLPQDVTQERWALGLSGGADSVALLLKCLEVGVRPVALHFNHAFADENGDEAEAFCRELCASLGVALVVDRREIGGQERGSKESRARAARMAFFAREIPAAGCVGILLAHQADDRAENLILRLARGCGAEGLSSFGWGGAVPGAPLLRVWRPLLDETHAEQVAWLKARGQSWVEDVSNADVTIPRNAIRHLLTPVLPHFTSGANASADLLAEESACLARLAEAAIVSRTEQTLELSPKTDAVLARRALRKWLPNVMTRQQTEALLALPVGGVTQVEGGITVKRVGDWTWVRL